MTLDTKYYTPPDGPGEYGTCGRGREECIRLDFLDTEDPGEQHDE